MSTLLYRIGDLAFRKPWYVIVGWIAILAFIVTGVAVQGIRVSTDMKLQDTPSQEVLDTLSREFPSSAGGQATVVFVAPKGSSLLDAENSRAVASAVEKIHAIEDVKTTEANGSQEAPTTAEELVAASPAMSDEQLQEALAALPPAEQAKAQQMLEAAAQAAEKMRYGQLRVDGAPVPGVLVAKDGSAALLQLEFTKQVFDLPESVPTDVVSAAKSAGVDTGIRAVPSDSLATFESPIGPTEVIGVLIAAIILFLTLGSLVAAGLPLITALIGVGVGVGGTYALSRFIEVNSITPILAMMIGLAVGIDYALFIVNRQRRLMMADTSISAREGAARAVGTAGSAVFFAGLTVIVALCGLSLIGISFLTVMALSAAATVGIAVVIANTLLPALLGLVGERIVGPKARAKAERAAHEERESFAHKNVGRLIRRRWWVVAGVVVILGIVALPATSMSLGIPSGASANKGTDSRVSYDAISDGFGPGFNGALIVVAHANEGKISETAVQTITQDLQGTKGVEMASASGISDNGEYATFTVIPTTGPTDDATKDLVHTLRDADSNVAANAEVSLGVTGVTAIYIDLSDKLGHVFPIYVVLIVGLSLVILFAVFRSIWVPITATLGFLLSLLATLGATTAVFQWGWFKELFAFDTTSPLLSFLPIIVTGIMYGLAMDYQVFLVSSMREAHVHGHRGRDAVAHGFDISSKVVVGAATIMFSVFFAFIFGDNSMIKQIGFALAIGILIDAFVIRLTLIPAVMAILSDKAWWLPKWVDRLMPNLDVEGDRLVARLNAQKAAAKAGEEAGSGSVAVLVEAEAGEHEASATDGEAGDRAEFEAVDVATEAAGDGEPKKPVPDDGQAESEADGEAESEAGPAKKGASSTED